MREAAELSSAPSPDYTASPLETDLFEWHFTMRGPPNSPYAEGIYHGRIVLPPAYPLRPPSFRFNTPSGRFEANREICLSISGHHEETWQPAWGVRTALVALRSFMETDAKGQLGGLDATDDVRRRLATESRSFRCAACGQRSNEEVMAECEEAARKHAAETGAPLSEEVEVPSDLKMGWRDEMGKGKEGAGAAEASAGPAEAAPAAGANNERVIDAESAQLAEGFVQTAPLLAPSPPQAPRLSPASLPARPPQAAPQPTRTIPLPAPQHHGAAAAGMVQHGGLSNEGVPAWIDRLIVVFGVLLAAMVLKVFLGA